MTLKISTSWKVRSRQKDAWRKKEAKKSFQEKIREVVQFQEWTMLANPKFREEWKGILPWGTYKKTGRQ